MEIGGRNNEIIAVISQKTIVSSPHFQRELFRGSLRRSSTRENPLRYPRLFLRDRPEIIRCMSAILLMDASFCYPRADFSSGTLSPVFTGCSAVGSAQRSGR